MSSQTNPANNPPEGPGHTPAENARDTIGGFLSISQQKEAAEQRYKNRAEESTGMPLSGSEEDTSFMNHKPGGSETLPGWSKVKNVLHGASE